MKVQVIEKKKESKIAEQKQQNRKRVTIRNWRFNVMSKYVERYWKEENRHPYILKCNNGLAGFVLQIINVDDLYNEYNKKFSI